MSKETMTREEILDLCGKAAREAQIRDDVCSRSTLIGLSQYFDIPAEMIRASMSLCGGAGGSSGTCGTYTCGLLAVGLKYNVPLEEELAFGDIRLDRRRLELCRGEERFRLGPKEFQVMECLLMNKNQIVPRNLLCEKVWGLLNESEYNNVEVYISFLRKKLRALHSDVQIRTLRNAGYFLEVQK